MNQKGATMGRKAAKAGWTAERRAKFAATMEKKRSTPTMESMMIPVSTKPRKKAGTAFKGSVKHSVGNTSFVLLPEHADP